MSDKIYACLLRLYPSDFRRRYQEEILQLYRDRLREEAGFLLRTRLWCDLLADAARSLPQAWRNSYATTSAASLAPNAEGVPSFRVLDKEPLRPASILAGSSLSLAVIAAFVLLMSIPVATPSTARWSGTISPVEAVLQRLNREFDRHGRASAASAATGASQAQASPGSPATVSIAPDVRLDAGQRTRVIQGVAQNLNEYYFDRETARRASGTLLMRERHGEYDGIDDGPALAARLTTDVRAAIQDPHVVIQYSSQLIPNATTGPSPAALDRYRTALMQLNCTFEKVEVFPDNIGYLKLNSFPDPAICGSIAEAAMRRLNRTDAIIFDLRDNTGGYPEMVALLAAPLFSHPVPWYNPRDTSSPNSLMLSPVPASSLGNKPVYILTSSRTYSGAEHFTYNLKMLKRAIVVGETTGGADHAGTFHRIDDHFGMGIPETRITNPYGAPDWAGSGVAPDVKVKAADALAAAEKLALRKIHKN